MITGHGWNLEWKEGKVQEPYCYRREQKIEVMRIERVRIWAVQPRMERTPSIKGKQD
jgi:hypothetical protein